MCRANQRGIRTGVKDLAKYRKKPVVIEALQVNNNVNELQEFIGDNGIVIQDEHTIIVSINTLEGVMTGTDGAYIIKGVQGEFYPCQKDIFEKTYEILEQE